jgi:lysophospholipase L1-like esterase
MTGTGGRVAQLAVTLALAAGAVLGQVSGAAPARLRVVAIGDSVTSGAHCACAAFPEVYGSLLAKAEHLPTHVSNDGISGLATAGLLDRLRRNVGGLATGVGSADVVLVTIGANDFGDHHDDVTGGTCSTSAGPDCVTDELGQMRRTLDQILAEIGTLRPASSPATVLVTGYWNDFEDGAVARDRYPDEGLLATATLTRRTNAAIARSADASGATYVDLESAFHRRGTDVTDLLAADGDHPNAAGHRLIARLLVAAGLPTLPK